MDERAKATTIDLAASGPRLTFGPATEAAWTKVLEAAEVELAPVPCGCGRPATFVFGDGTGPIPVYRHFCVECWGEFMAEDDLS